MIEGIDILNQTEIMTLPGWCVLGCSLCMLACVGWFIFSLAFRSIDGMVSSLIPLATALVILIFGCGAMVGTGRYEYEVTIDKSVDFIDIYENYDIIEQRGNIWVIQDKEK